MKSHFDRYFELLPALVIVLGLLLAEGGRQLVREQVIGPVSIGAPEQILDAPRLIFR
jgi:hypothetical protein